jgi:hypothetical protein
MKEQQHADDNCGGSTDESQDKQNLRSGSGVCERQAARNHQHGTHQSVMPVHRHHVAPYSARKPCVADRQRARKRSDAAISHPRLSCTQGATGVQSNRKGYRFVHTRDGRVHLPVFHTTPNAPQRQGRLVVLPPGIRSPDSHASRHGPPSIRRKRQCDENNRNEHLAGVRLSSSSSGSRPALLPGINARPSRLALPGPPWPPSPFQSKTQNETTNVRRIPWTRHRRITRHAADTNEKAELTIVSLGMAEDRI